MNRRQFCGYCCALMGGSALISTGCRGQHAQVITDDKKDMVGSCAAGAETYKPLVDEALCKLLARHDQPQLQQVSTAPSHKKVCFVGLENSSCEEMCDFKEQLVQIIETRIVQSGSFHLISSNYVRAGLRASHLRADDLFLPVNQRKFRAVMEEQGNSFDFLLFAKLTSGTTRNNSDMQRDYLLTLELVNIQNGSMDKESATLRKGYHQSRLNKALAY